MVRMDLRQKAWRLAQKVLQSYTYTLHELDLKSQNDKPYGNIRIYVPELEANEFPSRLRFFGGDVYILQIPQRQKSATNVTASTRPGHVPDNINVKFLVPIHTVDHAKN
ncbi:hypothetical protein EPUL_006592, partial [Erysiphe pulchra]